MGSGTAAKNCLIRSSVITGNEDNPEEQFGKFLKPVLRWTKALEYQQKIDKMENVLLEVFKKGKEILLKD